MKRSTTIPSKYPYTLVNGVLVDAQGKPVPPPEAGPKSGKPEREHVRTVPSGKFNPGMVTEDFDGRRG